MTSFSQTQQTVFALLRASLWGHPLHPSPGTAWDEVWQELIHQTVEGLAVDPLILCNPSEKKLYFHRITKKLSFWYTLMRVQQEACTLLSEHHIPCAVIKGAAAAMHYPQPTYRTMGDVDIIVKPEDCDRAARLLVEHGYQLFNNDNFRHVELTKDSIVLELHRNFSILKNQFGLQADQTIYAALDQIEKATLEGFSFSVLPRLENGMVILEHINHHMEGGLGLRQIIDWMLYVDAHLDDQMWQTEFRPLAQSIGLETLAVTTTRMCQIYLGLREDITWCRNADPDLCRQLIRFLMEQGNFGRKRGTDHNKTVKVLNSTKNLPTLLRQLHHYGRHNWEAAAKYPVLIPFSSFYQVCRYARYGFSRENPLRSLAEDLRNSREMDTFFQRLGVLQSKQGVAPVTIKEHQPKK